MTIKYREGRIHLNADPPSRAPLPVRNAITTTSIPKDFVTAVVQGYGEDSHFQGIVKAVTSEEPPWELSCFEVQPNGLLFYRDSVDNHARVCVFLASEGPKLREDLMHDFHDSKICGRLGMTRTINALAEIFYWTGITRDVKDYVRSYSICQAGKTSPKAYALHQPSDVPPQRWHTLTVDFAGPFVSSGEWDWDMIKLVVDKSTKRCHLVPSKSTDTASDTA
jgi:hypothetical protein